MSKRLFLIAPVYSDMRDLLPRTKSISKWFYGSQTEKALLDEHDITISELWTPGPGETLALAEGSTFTYPTKAPKGFAVRMAIIAALESVDRQGGSRSDAYFVQIDGSGAFDYKSVFAILKLLTKGDSIVLGRRTGEKWFMSHKDRKCVELFENELLRSWAKQNRRTPKRKWPDAQAGCWGFRLSEAQHLPLSAYAYELEFDLIASSVIASRPFVFTPPLIEGKRIGGSGSVQIDNPSKVDHRPAAKKMNFIASKLGWDRTKIRELLDAHIRDNPVDSEFPLPSEYLDALEIEYFSKAG